MLEVRSLSATYGQHRALEDASIRVGKGEIVVILGANGAGKSTLLKAVSGICEGQVSGSITMNGTELVGMKPDRIVEEGIALVPEGRGIFGDLSVEENLTLGAYAERAKDAERSSLDKVYALFPKLRERRRQIARTMSGGEQQMVAIGRAMMSNPSILTLDEPSLGLAPVLCKELFQNLKRVRDSGIGILLVEQNARASLAIADRGYLLENAHIIHEDTADKLASDSAVQKAYLGGAAGQQAPVAAPISPEPRPVPTGPSPSDIAAAAMQSLAQPKAEPVPAVPSPPPPNPAPAATPTPQPTPPIAANSNGIDIDALVNHARDISAGNLAKPTGSLPTQPIAPIRTETPRTRPQMPDINAHGDRLKTMLAEMEEAARRARQK